MKDNVAKVAVLRLKTTGHNLSLNMLEKSFKFCAYDVKKRGYTKFL
jgi:6-phosphogluconate dehydrogenase